MFDVFTTRDPLLSACFQSENLCAGFLLEVLWPIEGNEVTEDLVVDIISVLDYTNVSEYAAHDTVLLDSFDPLDPLFYGNNRDVQSTRKLLWDDIRLPVLGNAVTPQQLDVVTDVPSIVDIDVFLSQVRNPLESFELDDTHIYTRDGTVMNVIDDVLHEFDSELPLLPNQLPPDVAPDVVEGLSIFRNPLTYSVAAIDAMDSIHKRIDFHFPPLSEEIFVASADRVPLTFNSCRSDTLEDILSCLDSNTDPLPFYGFPLTDTDRFKHYEAPVDQDADLEGLANILLGIILKTDVAPFVPIVVELTPSEIEDVLVDVINEETISKSSIDTVISRWGLVRVTNLSGPVREMPRIVRPEELVTQLLWDYLLPELPVQKVWDYDDMIAAAVDELDIDITELDSEEPFRDEVAELMKLYDGRTPH
jgi:hypothetical protein